MLEKARTVGELKLSGWESIGVKDELRKNLIAKINSGEVLFPGILGYDETVIPEIKRAILAGHNINLLGLRGQAKTSIARALVELLDEYIPAIQGSPLMEDPYQPILEETKKRLDELGDDCPIQWVHRSERYTEKLATPDVSIADLIGDVDPIKAANQKLSYDDERAIHYGLVPRANRGIFVINELPDLQPRIQVALFNILQEGDVQIRGFKVRLALDVQFVFTANPEDYTNRGSIITPLKDRIQSQIMTHYPTDLGLAKSITSDQADIDRYSGSEVLIPELIKDLVEEVVFQARSSEFVDQKSGVSARLSITALECLFAGVELRRIESRAAATQARIGDLQSVIPAITGKIELVYEGEQEGAISVAHSLIRNAIRAQFIKYYPAPDKLSSKNNESPYASLIQWFSQNKFDLDADFNDVQYEEALLAIDPLVKFIDTFQPSLSKLDRALHAEFILNAMAEYSLISKETIDRGSSFNDMLSAMLS